MIADSASSDCSATTGRLPLIRSESPLVPSRSAPRRLAWLATPSPRRPEGVPGAPPAESRPCNNPQGPRLFAVFAVTRGDLSDRHYLPPLRVFFSGVNAIPQLRSFNLSVSRHSRQSTQEIPRVNQGHGISFTPCNVKARSWFGYSFTIAAGAYPCATIAGI